MKVHNQSHPKLLRRRIRVQCILIRRSYRMHRLRRETKSKRDHTRDDRGLRQLGESVKLPIRQPTTSEVLVWLAVLPDQLNRLEMVIRRRGVAHSDSEVGTEMRFLPHCSAVQAADHHN